MFSKSQFKEKREYLFLFSVGGAYLYALNRAIIASTVIYTTPLRLYLIGLFCLLLFTIIMFNRFTRIAVNVVLILTVLFLLWRREAMEPLFMHVNDAFLMAAGYLPPAHHLGQTLLWMICIALSFFTVVFMLHRFNFYVLVVGGGVVFAICWLSSFVRDTFSFLLFLFVFLLIFIRKIHKNISVAAMAAPLCLVVILLAQGNIPATSDLFVRRTLRQTLEGRFEAIEDFFYELFNPTYFTFATTGFSGAGGVLGGPITPDNRHVMEVSAPAFTYLSGNTNNHFTGNAWTNTLQAGDIDTHGMPPGRFEMLETAAALMREAGFTREASTLDNRTLRALFPDHLHELIVDNFTVMGWFADEQYTPGNVRQVQFWHMYLPMETVSVTLGRNRTGTVFRPPNTRHTWFSEGDYFDVLLTSPGGDLRTPGFMRRGTTYHHSFLHVNPHLSFVDPILHNAAQGLYASREATFTDYMGALMAEMTAPHDSGRTAITPSVMEELLNIAIQANQDLQLFTFLNHQEFTAVLDAFSVDVLAAHAESIRAHFMQVPDSVTQRVHDLTAELIRYQETDYERVMAIRGYLLANFPYTLTPVPVPRDVCFVDFFLFEGREGYCTYFATAMAVMARIAGIPSRYAEGFFVPGTNRGEYAVTNVTNRMAHAWAEVYLEGFGWLTIEATPPHAMSRGAATPRPRDTMSDGYGDWDSWMDHYMQMPEWVDGMPGNLPAAPAQTGTAAANTLSAREVVLYIAMLLGIIAGLISLFLLICRLRLTISFARVSRLDNNHQAQAYFNGILNICEYYHLPMDAGETTIAYGKRAGKRFAFRSDSVFLRDLIALYNRAKFGKNQISDDEVALMRESYISMLELLRSMRRRPYFVYLRYVRRIGAV